MSFRRTTLLIVDDDPDAREIVSEFARIAGFDIRVAASGIEALTIAGSEEDLDAVVCDLVMPAMDGLELAHRVRALRPNTAVLLMTGHSTRLDDIVEAGAVSLIKPFTAETFELAVRDAIDAHREDG